MDDILIKEYMNILKEIMPDMSRQTRYNHKKLILEGKGLTYKLISEIYHLRTDQKEKRLIISKQKNEIYQYNTYGLKPCHPN